jgi:hypothetical protein
MICHETPNLSVSQPQGPFSPPSESFSHSSSTSSCVSQSTKSEIPCANWKEEPPFSAMNSGRQRLESLERKVRSDR